MATTADTPDPTAAPEPEPDDDDASSPLNPVSPRQGAAQYRAVFDAMQDAEKAVSEAVRNMARPRAS
jgi:hypothetical protein